MDESAHGFSRKVLDRAFTLELSDIDLSLWRQTSAVSDHRAVQWPVSAWHPRALMLGALSSLSEEEQRDIERVIEVLKQINEYLAQAQLQIGYRSRDEIALFVLHSSELASCFVSRLDERVDPLDLAIHMKILPRIIGGSAVVRQATLQLLGWARNGVPLQSEDQADGTLSEWREQGRPNAFRGAQYPRTAARLCLMWERIVGEGFTSYWL
jgi:hypothetical protein